MTAARVTGTKVAVKEKARIARSQTIILPAILRDLVNAIQIFGQNSRELDRTVRLLAILKYRREASADRQPGTVQSVDKFRLRFCILPVSDIRPSRLEGFEIRAG